MRSRFILPPVLILALLCLLVTGELAAGTSLYFVVMMSLAVLAACLTYNLLGGLGTISGIGFSGFALGTLVVSQIGKAIVLDRADQSLLVPRVTITIYAMYYVSLLLGVLSFSRVRLPLPKPTEPETPTQSRYLYYVALIGGLVGTALGYIAFFRGEAGAKSLAHGVSLILGYFLPFSLVLAVDHRIRSTEGRHSFGWMALWPTLTMELNGFLSASRTGFVEPFAIIFLTCYLRDFKFPKRHIAIAMGLGLGFFLFVSPFYLYSRSGRGSPTAGELATTMIRTLEQAPSQWSTIKYQVSVAAQSDTGTVSYFSNPNAVTLNRFALIGPDSTLISACSRGFHYGFTSLKLDLLVQVPRILYRDKPDAGSGQYLGQLDGQEEGFETTTNSAITAIADSYGAFGWLGMALYAFFVNSLMFVVYESVFDARKPWGTVAAMLFVFGFAGGSMGENIVDTLIKTPLYLLCLSWGSAWLIRMIPATGDRAVTMKGLRRSGVVMGTND